jgi:hypothetical protein
MLSTQLWWGDADKEFQGWRSADDAFHIAQKWQVRPTNRVCAACCASSRNTSSSYDNEHCNRLTTG